MLHILKVYAGIPFERQQAYPQLSPSALSMNIAQGSEPERQCIGQIPTTSKESKDATSDGLENYDIQHEIGQGKTSIVHLAIVKRGRLRNRKVALKKTPLSSKDLKSVHMALTSLHLALHHPSIVSLLSTFTTSTSQYHVLELCSRGNLMTFLQSRHPPMLSESELRGLLKSLVDALVYLRKEGVIHGNIKAENILITDNYRIKLANFSLAMRNSTITSASTPRKMTSFGTDLWCLGCLMVMCLTGTCPTEERRVIGSSGELRHVEDSLPHNISPETRDIITSLLEIDVNQMPIHHILRHPFFDAAHPIQPLGPLLRTTADDKIDPQVWKMPPKSDDSRYSSANSLTIPSLPSKPQNPNGMPFRAKRRTLGDIGNTDMRHLLHGELSSRTGWPLGPTRRVVSDPLPRKGSLASELVALPSGSRPKGSLSSNAETYTPNPSSRIPSVGDANLTTRILQLNHMPLSSPDSNAVPSQRAKVSSRCLSTLIQDSDSVPCELVGNADKQKHFVKHGELEHTLNPILVGTTRPVPFTSSLLSPHTHKVVHGQVTVLPSRSVLVDFREGERRRGKCGDEVLVIDSTGTEVKVYSAPHLSTPCCLIEPTLVYPTIKLPSEYWKQYNDAKDLIDKIKQRTPKLILYSANAKCTLMANAPRADIELVFQSPLEQRRHCRPAKNSDTSVPSMRIRLSRRIRSIEIAQHVSGVGDGKEEEWTKNVLPFENDLDDREKAKFRERVDKDSFAELMRFLRVCEALEVMEATDADQSSPLPTGSPIRCSTAVSHRVSPTSNPSGCLMSDFPSQEPAYPSTHEDPKSQSTIHQDPTSRCLSSPSFINLKNSAIPTRFLPSIGWCVRYPSNVSQGGRYQVMFLDGATLEVDVDEEWIVCRGDGGVTRHRVGEWGGKGVGERMRVFERFVAMFEDVDGN